MVQSCAKCRTHFGNVINDDVIYDGPKELNQFTYKYDAGNGFTAVVSLEDSNSAGDTSSFGGAWRTGKADHYAPDVVAGAGYSAGAWAFKVIGGYDSVVEEGAIKARIDADLGVFKRDRVLTATFELAECDQRRHLQKDVEPGNVGELLLQLPYDLARRRPLPFLQFIIDL